jgi:hypothetical protein
VASGTLYAVPDLGFGSWESASALHTGNTSQIALLLGDDSQLAELYRGNRETGMASTLALLRHFIASGLMHPADKRTLDEVTQLLWLVGDLWLVFREAGGGEPTPADMDQGIRLFRRILAPHMIKDKSK